MNEFHLVDLRILLSNQEMDFHDMKRKQLQALCKEHGIPANLTNAEMANRLTSLLKEKLKLGSECCAENLEERGDESDLNVKKQNVKRVRFSPENETFIFVDLDRESTPVRRRRTRTRAQRVVETDADDSKEGPAKEIGRSMRSRVVKVTDNSRLDKDGDLVGLRENPRRGCSKKTGKAKGGSGSSGEKFECTEVKNVDVSDIQAKDAGIKEIRRSLRSRVVKASENDREGKGGDLVHLGEISSRGCLKKIGNEKSTGGAPGAKFEGIQIKNVDVSDMQPQVVVHAGKDDSKDVRVTEIGRSLRSRVVKVSEHAREGKGGELGVKPNGGILKKTRNAKGSSSVADEISENKIVAVEGAQAGKAIMRSEYNSGKVGNDGPLLIKATKKGARITDVECVVPLNKDEKASQPIGHLRRSRRNNVPLKNSAPTNVELETQETIGKIELPKKSGKQIQKKEACTIVEPLRRSRRNAFTNDLVTSIEVDASSKQDRKKRRKREATLVQTNSVVESEPSVDKTASQSYPSGSEDEFAAPSGLAGEAGEAGEAVGEKHGQTIDNHKQPGSVEVDAVSTEATSVIRTPLELEETSSSLSVKSLAVSIGNEKQKRESGVILAKEKILMVDDSEKLQQENNHVDGVQTSMCQNEGRDFSDYFFVEPEQLEWQNKVRDVDAGKTGNLFDLETVLGATEDPSVGACITIRSDNVSDQATEDDKAEEMYSTQPVLDDHQCESKEMRASLPSDGGGIIQTVTDDITSESNLVLAETSVEKATDLPLTMSSHCVLDTTPFTPSYALETQAISHAQDELSHYGEQSVTKDDYVSEEQRNECDDQKTIQPFILGIGNAGHSSTYETKSTDETNCRNGVLASDSVDEMANQEKIEKFLKVENVNKEAKELLSSVVYPSTSNVNDNSAKNAKPSVQEEHCHVQEESAVELEVVSGFGKEGIFEEESKVEFEAEYTTRAQSSETFVQGTADENLNDEVEELLSNVACLGTLNVDDNAEDAKPSVKEDQTYAQSENTGSELLELVPEEQWCKPCRNESPQNNFSNISAVFEVASALGKEGVLVAKNTARDRNSEQIPQAMVEKNFKEEAEEPHTSKVTPSGTANVYENSAEDSKPSVQEDQMFVQLEGSTESKLQKLVPKDHLCMPSPGRSPSFYGKDRDELCSQEKTEKLVRTNSIGGLVNSGQKVTDLEEADRSTELGLDSLAFLFEDHPNESSESEILKKISPNPTVQAEDMSALCSSNGEENSEYAIQRTISESLKRSDDNATENILEVQSSTSDHCATGTTFGPFLALNCQVSVIDDKMVNHYRGNTNRIDNDGLDEEVIQTEALHIAKSANFGDGNMDHESGTPGDARLRQSAIVIYTGSEVCSEERTTEVKETKESENDHILKKAIALPDKYVEELNSESSSRSNIDAMDYNIGDHSADGKSSIENDMNILELERVNRTTEPMINDYFSGGQLSRFSGSGGSERNFGHIFEEDAEITKLNVSNSDEIGQTPILEVVTDFQIHNSAGTACFYQHLSESQEENYQVAQNIALSPMLGKSNHNHGGQISNSEIEIPVETECIGEIPLSTAVDELSSEGRPEKLIITAENESKDALQKGITTLAGGEEIKYVSKQEEVSQLGESIAQGSSKWKKSIDRGEEVSEGNLSAVGSSPVPELEEGLVEMSIFAIEASNFPAADVSPHSTDVEDVLEVSNDFMQQLDILPSGFNNQMVVALAEPSYGGVMVSEGEARQAADIARRVTRYIENGETSQPVSPLGLGLLFSDCGDEKSRIASNGLVSLVNEDMETSVTGLEMMQQLGVNFGDLEDQNKVVTAEQEKSVSVAVETLIFMGGQATYRKESSGRTIGNLDYHCISSDATEDGKIGLSNESQGNDSSSMPYPLGEEVTMEKRVDALDNVDDSHDVAHGPNLELDAEISREPFKERKTGAPTEIDGLAVTTPLFDNKSHIFVDETEEPFALLNFNDTSVHVGEPKESADFENLDTFSLSKPEMGVDSSIISSASDISDETKSLKCHIESNVFTSLEMNMFLGDGEGYEDVITSSKECEDVNELIAEYQFHDHDSHKAAEQEGDYKNEESNEQNAASAIIQEYVDRENHQYKAAEVQNIHLSEQERLIEVDANNCDNADSDKIMAELDADHSEQNINNSEHFAEQNATLVDQSPSNSAVCGGIAAEDAQPCNPEFESQEKRNPASKMDESSQSLTEKPISTIGRKINQPNPIPKTPMKLHNTYDMKENTLTIKRDQSSNITSVKSTVNRRRPLEELQTN